MLNVSMLFVIMLSVVMLNVINLFGIIPSVVMLNVAMLFVIMLRVVLLNVSMLFEIMLSVVLLNVMNVGILFVIMLSVVAPFKIVFQEFIFYFCKKLFFWRKKILDSAPFNFSFSFIEKVSKFFFLRVGRKKFFQPPKKNSFQLQFCRYWFFLRMYTKQDKIGR
jgi:hypothetical protein